MMYPAIKIGFKKNVIIVLVCFIIPRNLLAMRLTLPVFGDNSESSIELSPLGCKVGSPTALQRVLLDDEKAPCIRLQTEDAKDLEEALKKMLNFENWLELNYSIQAIITPYKGKSDQRIQKYVRTWAISERLVHTITEKNLGIILKSLCVAKKIDLNKPDNSGFVPLTLAAYLGDPFVTRVLIAAGVKRDQKDRFGYTALGLARLFRYSSIEPVLSDL